MKIVELDKDLQDGVLLFSLLEILSGEQIKPKCNRGAKMKLQKIENLNFSMNFLRQKNIKLVNISAEGSEKLRNFHRVVCALCGTDACLVCCSLSRRAADIYEQKKKLILGLIWTLILRFQIQQVEAEDGTLRVVVLARGKS